MINLAEKPEHQNTLDHFKLLLKQKLKEVRNNDILGYN